MINAVNNGITFVVSKEMVPSEKLKVFAFLDNKLFAADIDVSYRPASRSAESEQHGDHWLVCVEKAMLNSSDSYEIKSSVAEKSLNLKILEVMVGKSIKTMLINFELKEVVDPMANMNEVLLRIASKSAEHAGHVQALEQRCTELRAECSRIEQECEKSKTAVDSLKTDMMQKMCLLLNSKKREVSSLRQQLREYESLEPNSETLGAIEKPRPLKKNRSAPQSDSDTNENMNNSKASGGLRRHVSSNRAVASSCTTAGVGISRSQTLQASQLMTQMLAPIGEEVCGADICSFLQQTSEIEQIIESNLPIRNRVGNDMPPKSKEIVPEDLSQKRKRNKPKYLPSSSSEDDDGEEDSEADKEIHREDSRFDILDFVA